MSALELQIGLQPKQERLFDLFDKSEATWFGYGGSRGGAKSDLARKIMLARRLQFKGTRGLIFRRTYDDLWENHITKFFVDWPITRDWYNGDHKEMRLPGGSVIKFDYAQKTVSGSKIADFQGKEFMDIAVDEAQQLSEAEMVFLKTCNRQKGVPDGACKMLLCFNPGGIGHAFLKRIFVTQEYHENEKAEDYKFLQAYGWDNVEWSRAALQREGHSVEDYYQWTDKQRFEFFIAKSQYGKQLDSLPQSQRIGWLLGRFDKFAGQYFDIFDRGKHVRKCELKSWYPRWISMDWAFGHNCSVQWHCALPEGRYNTYRVKTDSNKTPKEWAQIISELSGDEHISDIYVSPDANARRDSPDTVYKQLGREFDALGLPHPSMADNDREGGWLLLYQMLQNEVLTIDPSCTELIEKIPDAIRDEEGTGDDVVKVLGDDEIDSFRYGYKSRLAPAQAPLADRILARVASKTPVNETHRQMLMTQYIKEEREATEGLPFRFKAAPKRGGFPA